MAYRAKGLRVLGVTHFVIAIFMIILAIASFAALDFWISYVGSGIWVGIWVGLTGLFAYLGAKSDHSPNNCLIGLMIGFSVTACVEAGIMVILHSIALGQFAQWLHCPRYIDRHHYPTYHYNYDNCYIYGYRYGWMHYSTAQAGAAICSLLLILAVVEFFVALASSIYGCNACCCTTGPTIQVVPVGVGMQTYQTSYPVQPAVPNTQQQGYFAPPPPFSGGPPQQ